MNNQNHRPLPEPNPITRDRHQRQVLWQVFAPIVLAALIIIALAVLVGFAATPQVQRYSDISLIFMILPTALTTFLVLIVFIGLIYLTAKIIKVLPPYARLAQITMERITGVLKNLANSSTKPLMGLESAWAGLKAIFQRPGADGTAGVGGHGVH